MALKALIIMLIIVGGAWSTEIFALRKMIKMGKEEIPDD